MGERPGYDRSRPCHGERLTRVPALTGRGLWTLGRCATVLAHAARRRPPAGPGRRRATARTDWSAELRWRGSVWPGAGPAGSLDERDRGPAGRRCNSETDVSCRRAALRERFATPNSRHRCSLQLRVIPKPLGDLATVGIVHRQPGLKRFVHFLRVNVAILVCEHVPKANSGEQCRHCFLVNYIFLL